MTAARLDTNHSMFIKRTLRVKRTEISCPLLGQREDLLSHGSKTMAWERGGWPGTGAWRQAILLESGAVHRTQGLVGL